MAVYVDRARIKARVGNTDGAWSHLVADTREELHLFAARLGLRREWFQDGCRAEPAGSCVHWHYDVIEPTRARALRLGAVAIDRRQMAAILAARRAARA